MADRFSLTDDQVRQIRHWEKEKETLEREIAERQSKLLIVAEKLKAVAVLGGTPAQIEHPQKRATARKGNGREAPNLTSAIERIVTTSSAPLTKKQLKEKLAAEHFSKERLGPYFYTCLMRLKAAERIRVLEDGQVSKP
jgi:hypothetical protein